MSATFPIRLKISTRFTNIHHLFHRVYQYETALCVITSFHTRYQLQQQEQWGTFYLLMY
jgi:hypothetical protein